MRRTLFLLFFTHLFTRLLFINLEGVTNNYNLQSDSYFLVSLADESLKGNFSFDIGRFIVSPLYPIVCGMFKYIFHSQWQFYLILFQVLLSVISGLYIFRISFLLFKDQNVAVLSSLLFAFFPLTLWFVHTFSQESIFQSLMIFTIYYLLASLKSLKAGDTIKAAILFSLTYLTKSHILIFSLFIPLIYFHVIHFRKKTLRHILIFSSIAVLFSMPYGIYQYKTKHTYVISSNGAGYQFYLGNTQAGYVTVVDVPEKGSDEYTKMKNINVTAGFFNGSENLYKNILNHRQVIKQKEFFSEAVWWIKENPLRFIKLKLYDAAFFLLPGVSYRHYSFFIWLVIFLLSIPIYFFGYSSIFKYCLSNFSKHSWIFYLFLSMLIFSVVWYVQNRFRTITLEPFYIIYASSGLYQFMKKFSVGINIIVFLNVLFLKFLQSIQVRKIFFG